MIFTQEHYPFYSRPRLPELLAKEVTVEEIFVYKREWYNKNKIQLNLNCTVKSIDPKIKGLPSPILQILPMTNYYSIRAVV